MASHVYPKAHERSLGGGLNLNSGVVKVALVSASYTYSSAHEFRSAITAAAIATSGSLTSKSITDGIFDADNVTLTAVAGGSTIAAIVTYVEVGSAATDYLVSINDGFSQITNGGDIIVSWDNGSNKIFHA